jgi:hypothetical protein
MNNQKEKIPIMHLCIHKRLIDLTDDNTLNKSERLMRRKDIWHLFGTIYHIPKEFKLVVLKEMEKFELVEFVNGNTIKIIENDSIENLF